MAPTRPEASPMVSLQKELKRMKGATLSAAVDDADRIVALLGAARDQVANGKRRETTMGLRWDGLSDRLQQRTSTRPA